MFENKWPAFVSMALHALLLLESAQQDALFPFMGIVTGCALKCALAQAMTLVECELGKRICVTIRTHC